MMNFTDDARIMLGARDDSEPERQDNSSDDSDSSSESDNEKAQQDEETYVRFVRSVFCDEYSGCSNTDEDDEEDYIPDNKEDEDGDDDDDDRDLIRVQNRELRELVDGCWQTIVGEAPCISNIPTKEELKTEKLSSPLRSSISENKATHSPITTVGSQASGLFDQYEEDLDISLLSPAPLLSKIHANSIPVEAVQQQHHTSIAAAETSQRPKQTAAGPSAISNMVTKLFAKEASSEVCIEGMPLHACRKLVARQLSMGTQLLVQILLQADQNSECFTKGYTSLMELSNLRESAMKKASLIQMNYKNATVIRNKHYQKQQKSNQTTATAGLYSTAASYTHSNAGMDSSDSENEYGVRTCHGQNLKSYGIPHATGGTANPASVLEVAPETEDAHALLDAFCHPHPTSTISCNNPESSASSRRLTRSAMLKDGAVHSVFNAPVLAKISTLFDMIDASRRSIHEKLNTITLTNRSSINTSSSSNRYSQHTLSPAEVRVHTLDAVREQVYGIMPRLNMRAWRCLLPSAVYPLPLQLVRRLDPSSLTGRCLFTPTEDDLLLRGIMNIPEGDWDQIHTFYVPSKEAQLLQFRYTQMTAVSAVGENNFKRFQKLTSDYRDREHKWSHEEELQLLRGFQAFGERWPLVRMYYLPHRRCAQIKVKWNLLQRVWQKVFHSEQYKSGPQRELLPAMRVFLEQLNASGLYAAQLKEKEKGGGSSSMRAGKTGKQTGIGNGSMKPGQRGFPPASPASAYAPAHAQPMTLPPLPRCNVPAPMTFSLPTTSSNPSSAPTAGTGPPALGAFPLVMPPFMIPPWMPAGGKMPSNPAEFMAYQQQFQQYQQFMMHQYQVFMMQQQQHHMPTQQAPTPLPASSMINPVLSTPTPTPTPCPTVDTHTAAGAKSTLDVLNIDGPPLLKHVVVEKPKRPRKSRAAPGRGKARSGSSTDDVSPQMGDESQCDGRSASAALSALDEASRGLSYFHDQESLFSLLMPGNSVAYADPSLSIPAFDQDSAESNSQSQASLLSLVRAAASEAPVRTQATTATAETTSTREKNFNLAPSVGVFASLASATANNSSTHSVGIAKPAPTGLKQPAAASTVEGKTVLSKPKKKTIKPILIAGANSTASTGTAGVFDAARASPAFRLAVATGSVRTTNASPHSSAGITSAPTAAASSTTDRTSTNAAPSGQDERSMLEFDGLSNFNWTEGSRQVAERDAGLLNESSLHSPLLDGASLLDASRFEFSRLSHFPHELSNSTTEEGGTKQNSANGKKRKKSKSRPDKKAKTQKTSVNGRDHSERADTTTAAGVVVDDGNAFPFEEHSNMSLLGDIFNDGVVGAAGRGGGQQADFSNLSNLLSLSGSPNKLSFLGGSRQAGTSGVGSGSRFDTGKKKRSLAVAMTESSNGRNTSAQSISACSNNVQSRAFRHIAGNTHTESSPSIAVGTVRTSTAPNATTAAVQNNTISVPSSKKPRSQPSTGIFAAVMANVPQQQQ